MIWLSIVLGVGVIAAVLIALMYVLDDNKHLILKLVMLFFIMSSLLLIPKAAIDANTVCETIVNSTEEIYVYGDNYTGYHWEYESEEPVCNAANEIDCVNLFHKNTTYTYGTYCYQRTEGTALSFLQLTQRMYYIFIGYSIVYLAIYAMIKLVESGKIKLRGKK